MRAFQGGGGQNSSTFYTRRALPARLRRPIELVEWDARHGLHAT